MKKNIKKAISIAIIVALLMSIIVSAILVFNGKAFAKSSGLFSTSRDALSMAEYNHLDSFVMQADGLTESITQHKDIRSYVLTIVEFALGFLGLISVIIVIYGGVMYVTSVGDDDKASTGKKAIMNATIGLLIIMGSYAFVATVLRAGGGEVSGQGAIGANTGRNFNAVGEEVHSLAYDLLHEIEDVSITRDELLGIRTEVLSDSLDFKTSEIGVPVNNLVAKETILKFLKSTIAKVSKMQNVLVVTSESYLKINTFKRALIADMGNISNLPREIISYKNTSPFFTLENDEFLDICDVHEETCVSKTYFETLYTRWNKIRDGLLAEDGDYSLEVLFQTRKKAFETSFLSMISELIRIKQSLTGIEAANSGSPIGRDFDTLMAQYGVNPDTGMWNNDRNSFYGRFKDWTLSGEAIETEAVVGEFHKAILLHVKLAESIEKLKSVEAHLKADVITGKAPLVVTFDVIQTRDPAGATIVDSNVDWSNLNGSRTVVNDDGSFKTVNVGDSVTCNLVSTDDEVFGAIYRQCTYNNPGTYVASVTVKSSDPTKFVPGSSSLRIMVEPPTTKIELNMKLNNGKIIPIMGYYKNNGILKVNKDTVQLTLDEARHGVIFDASGTKNVTNFKWEMPFDEVSDGGSDFNTQEFSVKKEGQYKVALETINKVGAVDRKEFTVKVSDVAARIQTMPSEKANIGDSVEIDSGISSSSAGPIKSREWEITKITNGSESLDLGSNINKDKFSYKFKEPGKYKIDLYITATETVGATPVYITIVSKPPIATFTQKIKEKNQPGTVFLDASESTDPDGDDKNLAYTWTITPGSDSGKNWKFIDGTGASDIAPIVKFNKKDDYKITLKVVDLTTMASGLEEESSTITKNVSITDVLDARWGKGQETTAVLNEKGETDILFEFESDNGVQYELDFGDDSEIERGSISEIKQVKHIYKHAGKFQAKLKIYDADDNDTEISRLIFIAGGDQVIAKARIFIDGVEQINTSNIITAGKKEIITFDASDSKNTDGSGKNLARTWDFGDTEKSAEKIATHAYSEASPEGIGYYIVKLKVYDKGDTSKKSEDIIRLSIVSQPPTLSSLTATILDSEPDEITPVKVKLSANNAKDKDGEIVQYKWWYFNVKSPDKQLGVKHSSVPYSIVQVGTSGKEGEENTYGFAVEITDSDNQKINSLHYLPESGTPLLTFENGPNELPIAKFTLSPSSVYIGDTVQFSSASSDKDGHIETYIWDFDGDGFFNDKPTTKATVQHKYDKKNELGYKVRLKVIDDKGGEAISEENSVLVHSQAAAPIAAFKAVSDEDNENPKSVKFINNSKADTENNVSIISYKWDFDTASDTIEADSDGDGDRGNDKDSGEKEPTKLYGKLGQYTVKLTVMDSQGVEDSVEQTITVPVSLGAIANFDYKQVGNKIHFQNKSETGALGGAAGSSFYWDFDTKVDSDNDGDTANDIDSTDKDPQLEYEKSGTYNVILTMVDASGSTSDKSKDVIYKKVETTKPDNNGLSGEIDKGEDIVVIINDEDDELNQDSNEVIIDNSKTLLAKLLTVPEPSSDGVVYIKGDNGQVALDFSKSTGEIAYFVLDKNINYDTDGNGIKDDDIDFKTSLPGVWTTNFEKTWGNITVKLTVVDLKGNSQIKTQEIKFK